jgi:hypothetical protein
VGKVTKATPLTRLPLAETARQLGVSTSGIAKAVARADQPGVHWSTTSRNTGSEHLGSESPGDVRRAGGVREVRESVLEPTPYGQAALWEDMAGRKGDIRTVRALRRNITIFAANSAEARKAWIEKPDLDAWLIWNIWQIANKDLADLVPVSSDYVIYRDSGIALTQQGKTKEAARKFVEFVQSPEGGKIFAKWGWMVQ